MSEPMLSAAVVPLLRGIVQADEHPTAWEAVLRLAPQALDYLRPLGLEVTVDEAEGYAYVVPIEPMEGESDVPRLIARRQLSYRVSLMLALLRRRLLELDSQGDETRLVLTRDEAVELVRTHHPLRLQEAKLADAVEADLNKIVELGFLRRLRGQAHTFEVRRVLKAFVDAQWLADFDQRLAAYLDEEQRDS
ncbi:MAG: DUF4194 domain-containing protein [Jiangellales bacterium]